MQYMWEIQKKHMQTDLSMWNHEAKAWVELMFQAKLKLFKVAIQVNNFKDIK